MNTRHDIHGLVGAIGLASLVLVTAIALVPAKALAEPQLRVSAVNYSRGSVSLAVAQPDGVSAIWMWRQGSDEATQPVSVEGSAAVFSAVKVAEKTRFIVRGIGEDGSVAWESSLTVDPASFRPHKPSISGFKSSKVVGAHWSFSGEAKAPATQLKVYCSQTGKTKYYRASSTSSGHFSVSDVSVPSGRGSFKIYAVNAFGASPSYSVRVYNLGSGLPHTSRYILVWKSHFWMYDVSKGVVLRRWPVAIGMPGTPTPTGTFRIGSAQRSGGPWGPLRRPLLRNGHGTGYYIHGHAAGACWSIGTAASHGCVRMHNASIRAFTHLVPTGTTVRIR